MSNYSNSNHLQLAKFAFNIYGALNTPSSIDSNVSGSSHSSKSKYGYFKQFDKLMYNCEREVSCLTDLNLSGSPSDFSNYHVIIGGKNYLRMLTLNQDQTSILNETNIMDSAANSGSSRVPGSSTKLHNFNTIKSHQNVVAGGMVNGNIPLYQVESSGKSKTIRRFTDHKRCINSVDFLNDSLHLFISGSQDGCIKLWDLRQNNNKPSINILPKSNFDPVRSCQFSNHSLSRNKLIVLSVHDSGTLNKYDLRSINNNHTSSSFQVPERKWNFHTGPALSLNIHPEKEYVMTGGRDQKVCVWNYDDSASNNNNNSPEYIVHTYGPVMKVRWCPYPNNTGSKMSTQSIDGNYYDEEDYDDMLYELRDSNPSQSANNALFNYDFACLYLNEDPTITIYNLKRRYVPREVMTSHSTRPYQNFIWAKDSESRRKIWTLTKGNQFAAQCLDIQSQCENVSRPDEILNRNPISWGNNIGDLVLVDQDKYDFETSQTNDKSNTNNSFDISDNEASYDHNDDSPYDEMKYNKVLVGSLPSSSKSTATPPNTSLGASPMEGVRPSLFRSSTHNPNGYHQKSPSPLPQVRNSLSFYNKFEPSLNDVKSSQRPSMKRESSQNTVDSGFSVASQTNYRTDLFNGPEGTRKVILVDHPSPYVLPLSLPLPANDDAVFETLSNNYLLTIPDGFSLVDVTLLNASVAASVNRFRDCQIWRILTVGLQQFQSNNEEDLEDSEDDYNIPDLPTKTIEDNSDVNIGSYDNQDNRSLLSEYGNFVGSYNSNSTLTTNYGGGTNPEASGAEKSNINTKSDKIPETSAVSASGTTTWSDVKSSSTNNLIETINQNRNNINSISPLASRSNSNMAGNEFGSRFVGNSKFSDENAIEDDDNENDDTIKNDTTNEDTIKIEEKEKLSSRSNRSSMGSKNLKKPVSMPLMGNDKELSNDEHDQVSLSPDKNSIKGKDFGIRESRFSTSPKGFNRSKLVNNRRGSILPSTPQWQGNQRSFQDHDNENLNILNNAATNSSFSSSGMSSGNFFPGDSSNRNSIGSNTPMYNSLGHMGSFKSRRNSSIAPTYGFLSNRASHYNDLKLQEEEEEDSKLFHDDQKIQEKLIHHESALTKAIGRDGKTTSDFDDPPQDIPWKISNLLEKALENASSQGDVILCSAISLLFYPFIKPLKLNFFEKQQCLEWLSLYIEILHRKRLFVNAMNILNIAPKELQEHLVILYANEKIRIFCENCGDLITNEETKEKIQTDANKKFGYWFCDKCQTKQLNCVYCCEPSVGLNVIVSLKCGHRGHFGCLKEWFIEDGNNECPGGCNETLF